MTQTERARRVLDEEFGPAGGPVSVVSAPGRVNLIGGHTDYNDGLVLPMGIDRRTVVAARPREDRTVAVRSAVFGETASFDLDAVEAAGDGAWSDYVRGVADRLQGRGYDLSGAELAVVGGVPMGAGLSSSAAFEAATADALAAVAGHSPGGELVDVCWEAETEFVGLNCGIMDQYAATFAEPDSALFLDCRARDHEVVPVPAEAVTVVVTNTNVQRDLVESAYNDRVATCQEGVDYFRDALGEPVTALRDVSLAAFRDHEGALPETVRERVRHVVSENHRVREAADALRAGEFDRVGGLLNHSHASLRTDYEVSIDELDAAVAIANGLDGVFGSRMTGAGFGGCVVSLVRSDAVDEVTAAVHEQYLDETGIEPDVYACTPDGGVRRHES